jgi:hypothetical protein
MNSSNFRFVLDLHSAQSQISIPVTLGDTARVWYISLYDGGLPYIIEDGCIARVEIKRPTGTYIQAPCAVEKNTTVVYDFSMNEDTAVVDGIHDCSVVLVDTEGRVIGAPRFSMVVSDRVVRSDDINISDEDRNAIDGMMAAEASRQLAEAGRVNAEAARVAAEAERVNAEAARQTATNEAIKRVDSALVGADLSNYYTKVETDKRIDEKIIASVIVTLNTEV